jgi:hypothetical protein
MDQDWDQDKDIDKGKQMQTPEIGLQSGGEKQ